MMKYFLVIYLCIWLTNTAQAGCPNNCNSNGNCDIYGRCSCSTGFQGADCSERVCPFGTAWSDQATATDVAHAETECSNRGICDRSNGKCKCMGGFSGSSCERLSCHNDCNQKGICFSMRDFARRTRNKLSLSFTYENRWDADKIQGCSCDYPATGYDCSLRLCPSGDDPLTIGQVNEKQLLRCTATKGTFVLYYNGLPSASIPYTANAAAIESALLTIPTLTGVTVTFSQPYGKACQIKSNVITIEFTEQFGPQNALVPMLDKVMQSTGGGVLIVADGTSKLTDISGNVLYSIKGSKEWELCSGRGYCDLQEGYCDCYDTNGDIYASSDGYGHAGTRGDCGYIQSTSVGRNVTTCPGIIPCSGHGFCDSTALTNALVDTTVSTYKCYCSEGWHGGDCSIMQCPVGRPWFEYPTSNEEAHLSWTKEDEDSTSGSSSSNTVVCSDMGICNGKTGQCQCRDGFYGEACEYMACSTASVAVSAIDGSTGSTTQYCSGHGRCMTMSELALWSADNGDATDYTYGSSDPNNYNTWDHDRIHGCFCDEGFSGYDCSLMNCPIGDDPGTYHDHSEVQLLQCIASGGNFTLSFRQQVTNTLSYNITATELQEALSALSTIKQISVYYIHNSLPPNGTLNFVKPIKPLPVGAPWGGFNGPNGSFEFFHYISSAASNNTNSSSFCRLDGTQVAILHYEWTPGDLPAIIPDTANLVDTVHGNGAPYSGVINVFSDGGDVLGLGSIAGTTETDVCNHRGLCDSSTGLCTCFLGWTSSDGKRQGGPGYTGDCGTRNDMLYTS